MGIWLHPGITSVSLGAMVGLDVDLLRIVALFFPIVANAYCSAPTNPVSDVRQQFTLYKAQNWQ